MGTACALSRNDTARAPTGVVPLIHSQKYVQPLALLLSAGAACISIADVSQVALAVIVGPLEAAAVSAAAVEQRRLGRGRFNSSTFGAGVRAWANAFDQPGLPGSLGYASRAASAGRRRSRSGERPGSGDGHDSARNPIQLRQYLTRGPDEWDPTVDFQKWLSARGSSGPPPRIDRPVASSTSASPPPERIGYGEPGSSTDSSLNPTPRKWRPTEGGPKPRSRRASDTELTFSGRNLWPCL